MFLSKQYKIIKIKSKLINRNHNHNHNNKKNNKKTSKAVLINKKMIKAIKIYLLMN